MPSQKQIQLLGKRLRNGDYSDADVDLLDVFRSEFDPLLVETSANVRNILAQKNVSCVIAGRSKRTRSIIRKLQRPQNRGMDLSRMADLVGLRIVVLDQTTQDVVLDLIQQLPSCHQVLDHRRSDREYRAVHLIAKQGKRLIEIQLRSLAQQLWANESESFGEAVKEGRGDDLARSYLAELSVLCRQLDAGSDANEVGSDVPYMSARMPISAKLTRLKRLFSDAITTNSERDPNGSFVVVYDNQLNRMNHLFPFGSSQRVEALEEYRRQNQNLEDSRFEILILNSATVPAVRVSHPRFFHDG